MTAVARDAAGNSQTSSAVGVNVQNSGGPPPPTGLVAAFGFEEGSGSSVADASGRGNGGSVSGASWSTAGKFGKALSFDGVNDWVTVADSASLDLSSSAMTLEAWVRPTGVARSWQTVLMKEAPSTFAYSLYATGSDGASANGWWRDRQVEAPSSLAAGVWSHLAVTAGGGTARLFVNGTQVATSPATGAAPIPRCRCVSAATTCGRTSSLAG